MKKKIFTMAFVALAAAVSFVSCTKEDPAESVPNYNIESEHATIKGYILVKADYSDSTTQANKKLVGAALTASDIQLRILKSELHPANATFYSLTDYWTGTVKSYNPTTGEFTAEVPTSEDGATVEFLIKNYVANWTYEWMRGSQNQDSTNTKQVLWEKTSPAIPSAIVFPGETYTVEPWTLTSTDYKTTSENNSIVR